jgi:hypothetical protein
MLDSNGNGFAAFKNNLNTSDADRNGRRFDNAYFRAETLDGRIAYSFVAKLSKAGGAHNKNNCCRVLSTHLRETASLYVRAIRSFAEQRMGANRNFSNLRQVDRFALLNFQTRIDD